MRRLLFSALLSAASGFAIAGDPPVQSPADAAPQMTEISQKAAKPGEIVTVTGLGLTPKNVDEVYLTDHRFDMRVKVIEQTAIAVKFRVPPFAKPGRMQLLFLTKGDEPKLLEQPVYLMIEDPETEIATAKPAAGDAPIIGTDAAPKTVAPDSLKTDEIKSGEAKPDAAKDQPAKIEPARHEPAKTELVKIEQVKLDKQDQRQPK